jgi:hypothetical protein
MITVLSLEVLINVDQTYGIHMKKSYIVYHLIYSTAAACAAATRLVTV